MQLKARAQKGFTLIELMIVVAIIGILAAVAIPQYKDYTAKAKASSVIGSVASLQQAIALCIQENNSKDPCDTSNAAANIPAYTPTKEVASASVTDGTIELNLRAGVGAVDAVTITMEPVFSDTQSNVVWKITATNVTYDAVKNYLQKQNT
jgi:type IV pilus assembly protein PilA